VGAAQALVLGGQLLACVGHTPLDNTESNVVGVKCFVNAIQLNSGASPASYSALVVEDVLLTLQLGNADQQFVERVLNGLNRCAHGFYPFLIVTTGRRSRGVGWSSGSGSPAAMAAATKLYCSRVEQRTMTVRCSSVRRFTSSSVAR
jgi:hypothetical protein